ncbi:hypothetical protein THAOC_10822 [Thalassiosira oceanica]|uniref:Uncharacterized protein n=1 Tax=Thalassiosira oceanica TaxID=159749 RepID=K0SSU6_THAOC|nr:hypothetical protein THAOC_10822 [Thalassiosira oceanica]|eukprot:EJK68044.1 hypothetical protein THAOC_10822 [Thalassiosira oceanica]
MASHRGDGVAIVHDRSVGRQYLLKGGPEVGISTSVPLGRLSRGLSREAPSTDGGASPSRTGRLSSSATAISNSSPTRTSMAKRGLSGSGSLGPWSPPSLSLPAASSRAYPPSCRETMARASSTSWSTSAEQSRRQGSRIEASGSRWAPGGLRRSPRLRAKQPTRDPEVALPGNILASLSWADALSLIEAERLPPPAAPPALPQPEEVVVEPAEAPEEAPEPPADGGDDFDGALDDDDELDDDEGRGVKRDRAQQAGRAGDQPEGPGEDGLPAPKRVRVDGGYEWSPVGEVQRPVHLYNVVSSAEFGNTVSWASRVRRQMRRVKLDTHCQHRSYTKGSMVDEFLTGTKPVKMNEWSR